MGHSLAVGMTIGLRVELKKSGKTVHDYARQAIASFREAGFQQPLHVFVEPGAKVHLPNAKRAGLCVHYNTEQRHCFGNFKHGAQFLIDETDADWILMLQDDAIWRKGSSALLQAAIDNPASRGAGFLSAYASKAMISKAHKERLTKDLQAKDGLTQRWVQCDFYHKAFWGAVAMCFPRDSLVMMQTEGHRYRNHKHSRKLDVVVGNAIHRDLGLPIFMAVPSLVDHIGSWSTMGRHRFRGNQWGRRGFAFESKSRETA